MSWSAIELERGNFETQTRNSTAGTREPFYQGSKQENFEGKKSNGWGIEEKAGQIQGRHHGSGTKQLFLAKRGLISFSFHYYETSL